MKRQKARGFTLIEAVVAATVLGLVAGSLAIGIRIFGGFAKQGALLETHQEAQVVLYIISRDIRNAKSVDLIDNKQLVLRAFDKRLPFDVQKSLNGNTIFDDANLGLVIYEYISGTGPGGVPQTYLERKIQFGADIVTKKYLRNIISPPSGQDPIFAKVKDKYGDDPLPPYNSVGVTLRLNPNFYKDQGSSKIFQIQVMKRTISE